MYCIVAHLQCTLLTIACVSRECFKLIKTLIDIESKLFENNVFSCVLYLPTGLEQLAELAFVLSAPSLPACSDNKDIGLDEI